MKSINDILYLGITHLNGDVPYLKIQFGIEINGDFIKVKEGCKLHPVHGVTWYGRRYYKHTTLKDPKGPEKGDNRPPYDVEPTKVWWGCGWAGNDSFSRIAKR